MRNLPLRSKGCQFCAAGIARWADNIATKDRSLSYPLCQTAKHKDDPAPEFQTFSRPSRRLSAPYKAAGEAAFVLPQRQINQNVQMIMIDRARGSEFSTEVRSANGKLIKTGNNILHDFRRSAVRNLECAGVSQTDAMKIIGHKSAATRKYKVTPKQTVFLKPSRIMIARTAVKNQKTNYGKGRNRTAA